MPNVGRPSPNCKLCRERRVKCDLRRPGCLRCEKLGRPCPGYRNENDMVFRNTTSDTFDTQFPSTEARKQRRLQVALSRSPASSRNSSRSPLAASPVPVLAVQNLKANQQAQHQGWHPQPAPQPELDFISFVPSDAPWEYAPEDDEENLDFLLSLLPEEDSHSSNPYRLHQYWPPSPVLEGLPDRWQDHTLPQIFSLFFQPRNSQWLLGPLSGRQMNGSMDILPLLLEDPDPNLPLRSACDALALAYWQNRPGSVRGVPTPFSMYTVSLKLVNAALTSPLYCKRDETLLAIWMLGVYEVILHNSDKRPGVAATKAWEAHMRGVMSLLRLRGSQGFEKPTSRYLFYLCYLNVLLRCTAFGFECPIDSTESLGLDASILPPAENPIHLLCQYSHKLGDISLQMRHLRERNDAFEIFTTIPTLIAEIDAIEVHYEPQLHAAGIHPFLAALPLPTDTTKQHLGMLSNRNWYCAFRLAIDLRLLRLVNRAEATLGPSPVLDAAVHRSSLLIPPLATEVVNSVPYIVGTDAPITLPPNFVAYQDRGGTWGDVLRAMWPIEMVSYSSVVPVEQAMAARRVLMYIGNQLGIRQALSSWE